MFRLRQRSSFDNMFSSRLFDQNSFYEAFIDDLKKAKNEDMVVSEIEDVLNSENIDS